MFPKVPRGGVRTCARSKIQTKAQPRVPSPDSAPAPARPPPGSLRARGRVRKRNGGQKEKWGLRERKTNLDPERERELRSLSPRRARVPCGRRDGEGNLLRYSRRLCSRRLLRPRLGSSTAARAPRRRGRIWAPPAQPPPLRKLPQLGTRPRPGMTAPGRGSSRLTERGFPPHPESVRSGPPGAGDSLQPLPRAPGRSPGRRGPARGVGC